MKGIPKSCAIRASLLLLAAVPFLSVSACDSSRIISGVYQSEEPVIIEGADGFASARWVELMLAQFGPDLTGIVRVFDEGQFVIPADGICDCRYVEDGSVDSSGITITFRNHGSCPGSYETALILGDLTFLEPLVVDENSGDTLTGSFIVEGGDRSRATTVTFRRVKGWREIGDADLACDDPIVHGGAAALTAGGGE